MENNFSFKKKFGQNFISDKNLLNSILDISGISKDDEVLEIGTGKGALTTLLSERVKKVVTIEIDNELAPFLVDVAHIENVELIFGDCMRMDDEELKIKFSKFKLIANLPYYITTPIIFKFLPYNNLQEMIIMVQKEVADRMVANRGSKDWGVLSISLQSQAEVKIIKNVSRKMFFPVPNVDSAVVSIRKKDDVSLPANFLEIVKMGFAHRRKTLYNCMMLSGIDASTASDAIAKIGQKENIRGEALSIDDFINLANYLLNKN